MGGQHFRAGVVALIAGDDDLVLAFERSDVAGQWQLPQGGLDEDESPVEAVWRELHEETGLGPAEVRLVSEHGEWVAYEWPQELRRTTPGGRRIGQVQRWFLFRPCSADIEPNPDGSEFKNWKWVERDWLAEHVTPMRRASYSRMLGELR